MFRITVEHTFTAGHAIRLPDDSLEPMHEHDWHVTVEVAAQQLDEIDCVIDFHPLHAKLVEACDAWEGRELNDVSPFASADGSLSISPTAERVAQVIGQATAEWLVEQYGDRVWLTWSAVTEAPGCRAIWEPTRQVDAT